MIVLCNKRVNPRGWIVLVGTADEIAFMKIELGLERRYGFLTRHDRDLIRQFYGDSNGLYCVWDCGDKFTISYFAKYCHAVPNGYKQWLRGKRISKLIS